MDKQDFLNKGIYYSLKNRIDCELCHNHESTPTVVSLKVRDLDRTIRCLSLFYIKEILHNR